MVKKDRWGNPIPDEHTPAKEGDTTVNVNVEPSETTTVEKKTEKKVVVAEDDKSDDTPTPGTSSSS